MGLAAVSAVALTACGSSSSAGSNSASGALAQIEQTHRLTMAISAFAPQDYQNSSGKWVGYDPAILQGFAKTLGATLEINSVPFASAVEAVKTHRDDIMIDIYYNPQRAQAIGFSRPMLNYYDGIAVNASSPKLSAATVGALTGKTIAVTTGSAEVPEAQKVPGASVKQYDNTEETFLAVSQGRVDADFQPATDISYAKKKDPSLDIKLLGPVPTSIAPKVQRGYFGLPKGSYGQGLKQKLDAYLKKIECNGTEQSILDRYAMTNPVYLKGLCSASNAVP